MGAIGIAKAQIGSKGGSSSGTGTLSLADVSAASTSTLTSVYTMTAGVDVDFKRSGGLHALYIKESNGFMGVATNTPTSLFQIDGAIVGTAQTKTLSINDMTTTDFANIAQFNSNKSTARVSFVIGNNSSGDWANNFCQFATHGSAFPSSIYLTNFPKATDAGWTFLWSQGSQAQGFGIFTYTAKPLVLGANNSARLTVQATGEIDIASDLNVLGNLTVYTAATLNSASVVTDLGVGVNMSTGGALGVGVYPTERFTILDLFKVNDAGIVTTYNGQPTASSGMPSIVAEINTTPQTLDIAATTLYSIPASSTGRYRISAQIVTVAPDSTASTMPKVQIGFLDLDSATPVVLDVTPTLAAAGLGQSGTPTDNVAGNFATGVVEICGTPVTDINYQTVGYVGITGDMAFNVRITVEAL